jgi:2-keto-4-pentenoate hydratase/2-oxohepta-3-ene-1,7-dioic acid hydratase in catechol pathway
MQRATPEFRVFALTENLVAPVDLRDRHIAAGTNFPEHAGDAGVEDGPFLFAKLVTPTKPVDTVSAGSGLLDYEVELAVVTLKPLAQGERLGDVGLVLCNDLTDRATLFRKLDPWDVASGQGFTTGKSFPGYLPIGNLFVVPRDFRTFVPKLELRLYVNDRLRQKSPTTEMVWDFDEIVAQTWAAKDRRWEHDGTQVSLLGDSAVIPERTLLMSGTPHGTVFAGLEPKHYFGGLSRWLFGGWDESPAMRVVDAYIDDARAARAFLQPGDRVDIRVEHMGVVRTTVVP